jgi:diketogulonate reductase-like aldo/keto reductase
MKDTDYVLSAQQVRMPKIIYGTAWKKERTAALVEQAIKQGFRGIDTACQPKHYDEPGVGAGLAACLNTGLSREAIYLQTKFTPVNGQDPKRIPYDPKADVASQVEQSFAVSLANLQTDYLDCLILHSPMVRPRNTLEVWQAMETLVAGGGVRQLGLSNCYDLEQLEYLYAKSTVKPAVLQNRFYADTDYDREIRAFCRDHQILYESFWTLTANPHVLEHPNVQALAEKYGYTPAQIFFRYLTQRGIIPLTGTTSENHMNEDLAIFVKELEPADCELIDALLP